MALEEMVEVGTPQCLVCGKSGSVFVPAKGLRRWREGEYIQRAFPDVDAGKREQLMTGTHPACWDEMWKEEE